MKPSCGGKGSSRFGSGLFRKLAIVLASAGLLLATPGVFQGVAGAAAPAPPFHECPAVGYNTSCTLLIDVTGTGNLILKDPNATLSNDPVPGTYDGVEDTLIGIINNVEPRRVSSLTLSSNSRAPLRVRRRRDLPGPELDERTSSACTATAPTHSGNNYNNPQRLDRLRRPERVLHAHQQRLQDRDRQLHQRDPAGRHRLLLTRRDRSTSSTSARTRSRSRPRSATSVVGGPGADVHGHDPRLGDPGARHPGDVHA